MTTPAMPALGAVVHLHNCAHRILAGTVAFVNDHERTVNVGAFDVSGASFAVGNVPFVADGETPPETGRYCTTPPLA